MPTNHPSAAEARPRLAVGVVGAGRVGPVLGAALARAGHHIVAVSAVSDASRKRAAAWLPEAPVRPVDDVVRAADLVLLTVPDDALGDLVAGLAASGAVRPGQLLAHASGSHGVDILEPATRAGALPMALHPAMTFTDAPEDLDRLTGCPFGVTAPDPLRPVAEALVVEMGGEPVWVPEEARPLYHAALTTGASYLVTVVVTAMDLLAEAGVEEPGRFLGPLLGAALDNALRRGDRALTGPVTRGDAGTVDAHVRALADHPATLAAYVSLARATADRAIAAGRLDPSAAENLLSVLSTQTRPSNGAHA